MDEENRKAWMKEGKIKKLSGLEGCKRMAHNLLREEREAARDNYVKGGKNGNSSVSGVDKCTSRHKSAAPWARKFLPGSKESGSSLPESTITVGLTHPPNRHSWVAVYRNKLLQARKKRPTRTKSYQAGVVSEHRAFQIALSWLWGRHDLCCNSAEPRPSWVIDALADCSKCQAGELCEFMDNVRAREQPIGQGGADKVEGMESDVYYLWEGEGTSDSLSSIAPTEPVAVVYKSGRRC